MSTLPLSNSILISMIAASTADSASSRLRCFGLAREINKLGYTASVCTYPQSDANILYIQKIVNPRILSYAQLFKKRGSLVIYDIDDHGSVALGSLKTDDITFSSFLECVSIVTVDTLTRKETLENDSVYNKVKEFWVIPDPIDYIENIAEISTVTPTENFEKLHGCWFGNAPNIVPALPYLISCSKSKYTENISIITNNAYIPQLQENYPAFYTSAWELATFPSRLQKMDFCVLVHDSTIEGSQKSNNKMLVALAMGIVPFVSRTPAYEETALEIGIPELIVDSPSDIIDRLVPAFFKALQLRVRNGNVINYLEHYSPEKSARIFIDLLANYLDTSARLPSSNSIKLNLGCSSLNLPGHINVDKESLTVGVPPDLVCDIRHLNIFPDNCADRIISVNKVEYFDRWEIVNILKDWARVLKPGGRLIIETYNLQAVCEELLTEPDRFSGSGIEGERTMWRLYGNPNDYDLSKRHRWLYTPVSLGQVMADSGLSDIKRELPEFSMHDSAVMRITATKPY